MNEKILLQHLSIYRNEIWTISNSILSLKHRLLTSEAFKLCANDEYDVMTPDTEPHEIISSILNNASRLEKLFNPANQRDYEDHNEFKFRSERGKLLRKYFLPKQKKNDGELFKSSLRNSIEHFDERTDILMKRLIGNNLGQSSIIYNLTLNSKDYFKPWDSVIPVKILITESLEYYTVNQKLERESIGLTKIFKATEKIQKNIQFYVDKNYPEGSQERLGPLGIITMTSNKKK